MEEFTGCILEEENINDYDADDFATGDVETPLKVDLIPYAYLESQGTQINCTDRGICNCAEIEIYRVFGQRVELDAEWLWEKQNKITKVSAALQAAKDFGFKVKAVLTEGRFQVGDIVHLEAYATVKKDLYSIKQQLAQGKAIYTSCPTTKPMEKGKEKWTTWTYAKETGYIRLDGIQVGGHAWIIAGYDMTEDKHMKDGNSYGTNWGKYKRGEFRHTEDLLGSLRNMYVLYLKEDPVASMKDVAQARAMSKAIWTLAEKIKNNPLGNQVMLKLLEIQKLAHEVREKVAP